MVSERPLVPLRRNPNWRMLWSSQAVSILGDFVFYTTVVLWVGTVIAAGEVWAPAAVSGVLVAAAVPIVLVGPVAGVYVDRWDRRRIMMATDLIRAGLIALLLIVPSLGTGWAIGLQLSVVYATVAITSAASQFFNPARFGVVAATVPEAQQSRAFGLTTATTSTAAIIGPPLAAPLLFAAGVHWALIINHVSYLVSFLAIRMIRLPAAERSPGGEAAFRREFKEGLAFFLRSRTLVVLVAVVCLYTLGVGAINVLDVFFVTENLRVDASWLGTLHAALGVGSVLGSLLAAQLASRIGETRLFTFGIVLTGLFILIYSRMTSLPLAVVMLALASIPLAGVNVVVGPLVLRETPKSLLGRVNSVMNPLVYLSSILSMALAGFLASTVLRDLDVVVGGARFARIDSIFGVCAVLMMVAGLAAIPLLARRSDQPAPRVERAAMEVERP